MRPLILIAGALALIFSLEACGNKNQTDSTQNIDESLTAENIVSNDVTAIDAVTGDAANMAAESNVGEIPEANLDATGNMSSPTKPTTKPTTEPTPKRPPATARPDEPTTNTAVDTTGNTAE